MVAVECWASQSVTWVQQLAMVSTWMGDPLRSGIPSGYVTSQLGHLSLAALQGRLIKYQLWLGLRQECHLCWVAGNTVWSCMWVPVAVWQVRLRTAMLYFSLLFTCFSVSAVCCCNCAWFQWHTELDWQCSFGPVETWTGKQSRLTGNDEAARSHWDEHSAQQTRNCSRTFSVLLTASICITPRSTLSRIL